MSARWIITKLGQEGDLSSCSEQYGVKEQFTAKQVHNRECTCNPEGL